MRGVLEELDRDKCQEKRVGRGRLGSHTSYGLEKVPGCLFVLRRADQLLASPLRALGLLREVTLT